MQRITLRYLLHDVPHRVFHLDRGLLPTLWNLLVHPQRVVNGYLDGQRARWFNPLGLLVLLAGVTVVLFTRAPIDFSAMAAGAGRWADDYARFARLNFEYYTPSLVLYLPLVAALSRVVFAGRGRNYAEHLVINAYAVATASLAMLPVFPLLFIGPAWVPLVWMAITLLAMGAQMHVLLRTFLPSGTVAGTVLRTLAYGGAYLLIVTILPTIAFFVWLVVQGKLGSPPG